MKSIRIATRASKLALAQTKIIRASLQKLSPDTEISIVEISTKGDRDKSTFLHKLESVGFFTSEVENALLNNNADLAVHSSKDLPTTSTLGLAIAAIPKRDSVADVLVASEKTKSIDSLPTGATIGTSSLRRIAQLRLIRKDLNVVPLRGNVETRVNKVISGELDAIIVAQAGLNRLGLTDKISAILPPDKFLPAPGQGALAVQIRNDNKPLAELVLQLNDEKSRITAETERHLLATLQGGCSIPLGTYSQIQNDTITITAILCDIEGNNYIKQSKIAPLDQTKICAEKLANALLTTGGKEILEKIRNAEKD